jgi:DNA-binding MarR family transcriptional regulator
MANPSTSRSARKQRSPDIAILASRLLFALQDEMFQRLAVDGHSEIRPRHGAVLAYLDADGTRATDLAAMSGRHKQVIGTLVDELEALGYVERIADPNDRRAKLIRPTTLGLDEMEKSDAIMHDIETRFASAFPESEFEGFKEILQAIVGEQEKVAAGLGRPLPRPRG